MQYSYDTADGAMSTFFDIESPAEQLEHQKAQQRLTDERFPLGI